MPVVASDTAEKLGEVEDVLLDFAGGRVVGIVFRAPEGEERVLATSELVIGKDAVMARSGARGHHQVDATGGESVAALRQLAGAAVVTETGELIGRIGEIYVSRERPVAAYRVVESTLQKFLGGGLYLPAGVLRAVAPDGARVIVPADIERSGATTLGEIFQPEAAPRT